MAIEMKQLNTDELDRLEMIKDEIKELIGEAKKLVRGTFEEDRAKSYWVAHMQMALDGDHNYLGSGGHTMQDTIEALRESGC